MQDKYIGLLLAISSSIAIGTSFIITKKGLIDAGEKHSHPHGHSAADAYTYLKNPLWWAGMSLMIVGELANFAAYSFAPAILVTPLGALSVIVGSILASIFLGEKMGREGKVGAALCILGSVVIILHAPAEKPIESVDEILQYAVQPAFLVYCFLVVTASLVLIYKVAPIYGKKNLIVYVSICSLVGSISVMACKGFGIALKLTFSGNNQLIYPSTYVFAIVVGVSVVTQMNYFNKALDIFSTNMVTPVYYVFFTTATIIASVILFQGFDEADTVQIMSVFCGFITIFLGVFLLNSSKYAAPNTNTSLPIKQTNGAPGGRIPVPTSDPGEVMFRASISSQRNSMAPAESTPMPSRLNLPNTLVGLDGNGSESLLLSTFSAEDDEQDEDMDLERGGGNQVGAELYR